MYINMKDSNQDELVRCIFLLLVTREWLASYLPEEYDFAKVGYDLLCNESFLLRWLELNVLHHRSYQENRPCMSQCSFMSLNSLRWLIDILTILSSIPLNLASVLYRVLHWFLAIKIQIRWDKFDLLWCKQPLPNN